MKYIAPVLLSRSFSGPMTAETQYFLDGQQLSVIDGENFCGEANDSDAFIICLSGSEDISAQLAGLTVNSTDSDPAVIVSCTANSDADCSGLLYQCTLSGITFEGPQCITSITNGDETVSCSSNACTPTE
jgi:hypothetical protein